MPFTEGVAAEVMERARERGEAVITETFAQRFKVKKGEVLRFPAPGGEVSIRIAGIYYDYSADGGRLLVDRALFRRIWKDDRLSSMAIYLKKGEGVDRVAARRQIEGILEGGMTLISNSGLRRPGVRHAGSGCAAGSGTWSPLTPTTPGCFLSSALTCWTMGDGWR